MLDFLEKAFGKQGLFTLIFLAVTGALAGTSFLVVVFVNSTIRGDDPMLNQEAPLSPIYVDYRVDVDEYVSGGSYLAMAEYQQEYDMPRNVRILTDLTTQEINGYMLNHFVGGLHVNCTYCHNINNFAAGPEWEGEEVAMPEGDDAAHPEWEANKTNARRHLELVQDLNRNWVSDEVLNDLTAEKKPSGSQMSCAVCHNGQAQPEPWPADQAVLPDDFRLPLDEQYDLTAENIGILNVNARTDISLDTVQYQQQVMYHMNQSMNVGCTHCHNSRYFPSREVPAIHYAQHMLQMSQYIWLEYGDSFAGKQPSCTMCHQGNIIPAGAAISVDVLPETQRAIDEASAELDGDGVAQGE